MYKEQWHLKWDYFDTAPLCTLTAQEPGSVGSVVYNGEVSLPQTSMGMCPLDGAMQRPQEEYSSLPPRNMPCTFLLKHMDSLLYLSFPTFERNLGKGNISLRKTIAQEP